MKKWHVFFAALMMLFSHVSAVPAQTQVAGFSIPRIKVASSPNPVGSGARAQGMGGAFIAVADDATAASWNPGGLIQLERPELSFVVNMTHRRKDLHFSEHPRSPDTQEIYREDLNYFSIAFPFRAFDKNMIVSLNYQRLYDFYDDMEFDFEYNTLSPGAFFHSRIHTDYRQRGGLKAISPAFAVQLTPRFSIGITLNIWTDNLGFDNQWKNVYEYNVTGSAFLHATQSLIKFRGRSVDWQENENFEGFNFNIGFLWDISSRITIGGVLKTPFTADIDRTTYRSTYQAYGTTPPLRVIPQITKESIQMHFPLSFGIGIALRLSDRFTLAGDVYYTDWSDFWIRSGGVKITPITSGRRSDAHVHDTTQVRIGCEYLFILEKTIIPLRFGAFYDPQPTRKNPDDYFGITAGTGIMLGPLVIDCCYIYRWGDDVMGDSIQLSGGSVEADADQHRFLLSVIYHF